MGPGPNSRIWQIDALKGVAITLVVLMHAYYGAPEWAGAGERQASRVLYYAGHLAVPVFFLLSGYLYGRERRTAPATLRHKLRTVALPALIWSAVAIVIRGWWLGLSAEQALIDVLLFNASGQYFYILVLGVFFAGAAGIRGASVRMLTAITVVAFALGLARVALAEQFTSEGAVTSILAYRDPLIWAGFFTLGLRVAAEPLKLGIVSRLALGATLGVNLGLWFASGDFESSYFNVAVIGGGVAVTLLAASTLQRRDASEPVWAIPAGVLGQHSFAIFLAHMPLFIGLVSDYWYADAWTGEYWTRVAFRFVVGLGGPLLLIAIVRMTVPGQVASVFGFEGRARTAGGTSGGQARSLAPGRMPS